MPACWKRRDIYDAEQTTVQSNGLGLLINASFPLRTKKSRDTKYSKNGYGKEKTEIFNTDNDLFSTVVHKDTKIPRKILW